jgi:hypothetical protein
MIQLATMRDRAKNFSSPRLLNPNPLANPGKLLQDDRPLRAFGFFDELFRNLVKNVPFPPGFQDPISASVNWRITSNP